MNPHFIDRPGCELCGSTHADRLLSRSMTEPEVWEFLAAYYQGRIDKSQLEGACYEILRCQDCGFAWQGQVLRPEAMKRLYGEWISAEESLDKKRKGSAELFRAYAAQAQRIAALTRKPPHENDVLDYGMGWGYWCRMAQAFGYRVVGFEVDEQRVAHARGLGIQVVAVLPPALDGAFDYINAEQVFEHITQPLQKARELAGALRRGGVLRISVPDAEPLLRSLGRPDWRAAKDALHPLEHINAFTHATLRRLGSSAGLVPILPEPSRRGWLARLRALLPRRHRDRGGGSGTTLLFRKP